MQAVGIHAKGSVHNGNLHAVLAVCIGKAFHHHSDIPALADGVDEVLYVFDRGGLIDAIRQNGML